MTDKRQPQPERARFEAEAEARFLAAAKRARRTAAFREEQAALGLAAQRRWTAVAASVVLAIGVVSALVYFRQPIEQIPSLIAAKETEHLVKGVVYSSTDELPLAGVKIYALPEQPDERAQAITLSTPAYAAEGEAERQLLAVSDAVGEFWVEDNYREQSLLKTSLFDSGVSISAPKVVERAAYSDVFRLYIDTEAQQKHSVVNLLPGEIRQISESIKLELADDAPHPWNGVLIQDAVWPNAFRYGQLLEGVLSLSGEVGNLAIHVRLNDWLLQKYRIQAEDAQLVVENEEYATDIESFHRYAHQGWYDAGNPPSEFDYLTAYQLEFCSDSDGKWAIWQPNLDVRYALKSPVATDGKAISSYFCSSGKCDLDQIYTGFTLIDCDAPQPWLYEAAVLDQNGAVVDHFPVYFQWQSSSFMLKTAPNLKTYSRGQKALPQIELGSNKEYPLQFKFRRLDFTSTEAYEWPTMSLLTGNTQGTYSIEWSRGYVGEPMTIKLTGDRQLVKVGSDKNIPKWDLLADGTIDARGFVTEVLLTQPGWHELHVLFEEKSGAPVVAMTRILVESRTPPSEFIGYDWSSNAPILAGSAALPSTETSLWVLSQLMHGSPPLDRRSLKLKTAGPKLYINPPADFRNTPLRELRIVMFVSPREDPPDSFIWFSPEITPTTGPAVGFKENAKLLPQMPIPDGMTYEKFMSILDGTGFICSGDLSWRIRRALKACQPLGSDPDVVVTELLTQLNTTSSLHDRFWLEFGINLQNDPPSAEELTQLLLDYYNGPYYQVKRPLREKEELVWHVNLRDAVLESDVNLIVGLLIETMNRQQASQYEFYSGGDYPARIELETADGQIYKRYYDYTQLDAT